VGTNKTHQEVEAKSAPSSLKYPWPKKEIHEAICVEVRKQIVSESKNVMEAEQKTY